MSNIKFGDEDKLRRVTWVFWFYETRQRIVLDSYTVETRPSARHKFTVETQYNRLSSKDAPGHIKEVEVPLTDEVKERAMQAFIREVKVVTWSEVPR